ncbi:hypothetical protein FA13DRAFT_1802934 [Coprinellus micaceus]|uniref:Uncharacterized protein n=1 Tax=Coprinellus micaceus TaxID=71717 RepID=A0A4Y7SBU2_COPMI|nr:hypothetical protein FA13DRAFT_1802934 [Coprinellus micaceus]
MTKTTSSAATRLKHHLPKPRQTRNLKENGPVRGGRKRATKGSEYIRAKLFDKPPRRRQPLIDIEAPETQAHAGDDSLQALEQYSDPLPSEPLGMAGRGERLNECIRQLEEMANGFKEKVNDLSEGFEALRAEIDDQLLKFNGLEQDYAMAMECVKEEKETVQHYGGLLANTERQVKLLSYYVPEEHRGVDGAFSQARPW